MKIVLPKPSRGWHFSRVFAIEMNDFDVERLLPSLFHLAVTQGRRRGPKKNDAQNFDLYLERLVAHERLQGFDSGPQRRMLARWVRAAIARMGGVGRSGRNAEQIEFVMPLTLLSYKTGFPSEIRRQRNAHVFLYQTLLEGLRGESKAAQSAQLRDVFLRCFGKGIREPHPPAYDAKYDGESIIDAHALLSLCYLDGFEASPSGKLEDFGTAAVALPPQGGILAEDILRYLLAYENHLPVSALIRGLQALINFELFAYTVKLIHAVNHLVARQELPGAMQMPGDQASAAISPVPELYVDFTRQRMSPSDELARACVDRDLEELRYYVDGVFLLRTVERLVEFVDYLRTALHGCSTPQYLLQLRQLVNDETVLAGARQELSVIKKMTLDACQNDTERDEAQKVFDVAGQATNPVEALVALLSGQQASMVLKNTVGWYWSVGGLRKAYGILSGNVSGRRNWRYAMSDDLLATLVHLAMAEDPTGDLNHCSPRPSLRLRAFLQFLEERYGILVDRPPAFLDNASARAAAALNLEALKRRLRQMGFFYALSDDFNAQYLQMPALAQPQEVMR